MPFDLEAEIARRLNVPPDTIGPVLNAVIERISQQVSHYGYARVAGLGTFRGQNGDIAFEPDPLLSEEVNLRFAGLEEVRVAAVGIGEEEEEALEPEEGGGGETLYGDSPGDDYERHEYEGEDSEELGDEADEDLEPPEESEESELEDEPLDVAESKDEPLAWAESEDEPSKWAESEDEPSEWAESEDEPSEWAESEDEPAEWSESEDEPVGWVESADAPVGRPGSEDELVGWAESSEEPDADDEAVEELYAGPAGEVDTDEEANADVPGAEPIDDAPESTREPFPWDDDDADLPEMDAPSVTWADDDDELIESTTETDTEDEWLDESSDVTPDEIDESATWLEQPAENHPLGPVPEEPFEEADYSVLEEQRAETFEDRGEELTPYGSSGFDLGDTVDDVQDQGDLEDDYDVDDVQPEFGNKWDEDFDGDLGDTPDEDEVEGPTVEWSPLEEESGSYSVEENYADEAAMAAGGMAAADYDESKDHIHHDKAPDREALPHERIRQHPPRRHSAAQATGGGAAGGNRNAIWIGVGVIVVIAAAAIAYFTILPTAPTDESPLVEQTEPPALADTSAAADADATRADTTAAAIPPPVEEEEISTPLRSISGIDTAEGGFTIIVYSETSESGAEDVAARYRNAGFRTSVLEYQENGATRYRVGVGQFTTLDEAAGARDDLAGDELPDDAWVRRVQ